MIALILNAPFKNLISKINIWIDEGQKIEQNGRIVTSRDKLTPVTKHLHLLCHFKFQEDFHLQNLYF